MVCICVELVLRPWQREHISFLVLRSEVCNSTKWEVVSRNQLRHTAVSKPQQDKAFIEPYHMPVHISRLVPQLV